MGITDEVSAISSQAWFRAGWAPCVVLDTELRIQAVNEACARAVAQPVARLRGESLFDMFPGSVEDRESSRGTLEQSLSEVLRTGQRRWHGVQRYDLPDPARPGVFIPKIWTIVNTPIRRDGRVVGVVNHSQDLTPVLGGAPSLNAHDVTSALAEASDELERQFPTALPDLVLSTLAHSHRVILESTGRPSMAYAVALARLRLELRTGAPARPRGGANPPAAGPGVSPSG